MKARLRAARLDRGMTVEELAEDIGVSKNVIYWVEQTGRRPNPDNALKVAEFLGQKVTEIWPVDSEPLEAV